jgi:hypothetical protein
MSIGLTDVFALKCGIVAGFALAGGILGVVELVSSWVGPEGFWIVVEGVTVRDPASRGRVAGGAVGDKGCLAQAATSNRLVITRTIFFMVVLYAKQENRGKRKRHPEPLSTSQSLVQKDGG